MTSDETYNGYANRETWAFNLHWQNDQDLYNETLDYARQTALEYHPDADDYRLGELIVDHWRERIDGWNEELGGPLPFDLLMFDREVGSWWRIDYCEVGEAVRESLVAESTD